MEKAAGDSTKQLPVYKEYPDGFKWVELKLPEKLTEEQAKQVKSIERLPQEAFDKNGDLDVPPFSRYVAIGADGKPIKNSYTDSVAAGKTPEEAWLAGRLAEEGNQMGHCAGGYCEGVASGESRIFSLRDPKGKSHVTIEATPPIKGEDLSKIEADIQQIKGKQNRAPSKEYLPYVQDFVKGGKWGEVGDLGNTGLAHDRATGRYLTPEEAKAEGHPVAGGQVLRIRRPREEGKISQEMVVGLSMLGLGGLAGSFIGDDPLRNGVLGALAGAAVGFTTAGRARLKDAVEKADFLGGRVSTRLGNYSPALKIAVRDVDRRTMQVAASPHLRVPALSAGISTSFSGSFSVPAYLLR